MEKAIAEITSQSKSNIEENVKETLLELDNLKRRAKQDNDKRIELEALKYQSKIKGNEVERVEVKTEGNIVLTWGGQE